MRFMMIVKANQDTEAGIMPSEELLAAMAKYSEELVKAGVMLDGAGLQPSSKGARVRYSGGKRSVVEGPFPEPEKLIAGYWLIQVKSKAEAIDWAKRVPAPHGDGKGGEIEIRQLFELEDFSPGEAIEHHRALADELAKRK